MSRSIGSYLLKEKIYESPNSEVYRGIRETDCQPFILKILKQDYPSPQELTRYRQEYEITRRLNVEGVISAYAIEPDRRTLAIVLEDFGATSLAQLMDASRLFPSNEREHLHYFLTLAIAIVDALRHIHAANIIHKDINPSNIVHNPETGAVKIIDFGISTVLSRENPTLKHPSFLEGTLPYMSPEQTGRMNRAVDYRTDFYSLGATFYELLTGQTPFSETDVMELVHCHLAKQPEAPNRVLEQQGQQILPFPIARIVMKLMAKTAEKRYQSAWGIKADLEECLKQLEETGQIEDFSLASRDISDKFQIPQKLYGREREIEALLAAFERVSAGPGDGNEDNSPVSKPKPLLEIMLVAGQPGIGKSALVREIYKPITEKRGYFISGKFDQFQRNVPYSALVGAFRGLVCQLLTESEERLERWKERLLTALQSKGQIVIDIIPEVELIIGKQPEVAILGPVESQNRFNLFFRKFIQVFCKQEHPLIIFLDDLQWIDAATLKLIEAIAASNEIQYLFLIGAYRDNEVSATHPLTMALDNLRDRQVTIHEISLSPLSLEWLGHLIAETYGKSLNFVMPLAQLVQQKTQGNPFFVNQFLRTLYRERLVEFNFDTLSWQWDISQIESQNITDNVVDLAIANIKHLSSNTQGMLRLAACIGASFDLYTLSIVCQKSSKEIFQNLLPAVQSGFVLPISDLDPQLLIQDFKFSHDRIQQAAYVLIEENEKSAIHLQIGNLLRASLSETEQSERLFEIIDHLNIGRELINCSHSRVDLAELNLKAARKAKESIAYKAALQYLSCGAQLLSVIRWEEKYRLKFELAKELSEVYYLNGDFDNSEALITTLIERGRSNVEKAEAYGLLIAVHTMRFDYIAAIAAGRRSLQLLKIELPEDNFSERLKVELAKLRQRWEGIDISTLASAKEMQSPEKITAVGLLMQLLAPAYLKAPDLFALIAVTCASLSLQDGPTPDSVLGYSCYGSVLSRAGDYYSGYQFTHMAAELARRFGDLKNLTKADHMLAHHAMHWVKPLSASLPIYKEGLEASLMSGDFQFGGYLLHGQMANEFSAGRELQEIVKEYSNWIPFLKDTNNLSANNILALRFAVLNLLGETKEPFSFEDDEIDEETFLDLFDRVNDSQPPGFFYVVKLQVAYLYGNYELALRTARTVTPLISAIKDYFQEVDLEFFYALSLLGNYNSTDVMVREQTWQLLESKQEQLKIWSNYCPENCLHKYLLLEAEVARVTDRPLDAMELYDRAIASAAEHGFVQHEALASELAAKFWLEQGREKCAKVYLRDAHYCYQLWGAKRKVQLLEEAYPQWFAIPGRRRSDRTTVTQTTDGGTSLEALDLNSVLQASQTISEEILLENLLAKLMKLAIENAGAQCGCLLLEQEGKWAIEAEGCLGREEIVVLHSTPIDISDCPELLSSAIVNYVARSLDSVVLDNAALEGRYSKDPHIVSKQVKSVLCIPLLTRGDLSGILYLENNLIEGAFTPDRIEILKLLSSQAAISLNNARLYVALQKNERNLAEYNQTLEQRVRERTAELASANQRIMNLNEQLRTENLRMEAELNVARRIQQMILPRDEELKALDGLDIACLMEPAAEVAGDYYDVLQADNRIMLGIGDVTGHGLESGLLMLMAQTAVRTLTEIRERDPVKFLGALNRAIYSNVQRMDSQKSLTLAILDYWEGHISISGQHEEVLIVRANGCVERIDTIDLGMPIGLDDDIDCFISQETVNLEIGDGVVLYTDGILEAINLEGKQYGMERFCSAIQRGWGRDSQGVRQTVIEDMRHFIGEQRVYDDIALLVLKRQ